MPISSAKIIYNVGSVIQINAKTYYSKCFLFQALIVKQATIAERLL